MRLIIVRQYISVSRVARVYYLTVYAYARVRKQTHSLHTRAFACSCITSGLKRTRSAISQISRGYETLARAELPFYENITMNIVLFSPLFDRVSCHCGGHDESDRVFSVEQ